MDKNCLCQKCSKERITKSIDQIAKILGDNNVEIIEGVEIFIRFLETIKHNGLPDGCNLSFEIKRKPSSKKETDQPVFHETNPSIWSH